MKRRLLLLLAGFGPAAWAQEVWRCGPGGRTYTQQPCPGGQRIDVPAPRPAEDVDAARQLAAREAAYADKLRRERIEFESRTAGNGLVAIGPESPQLKPQPAARPGRPRRLPRRRPTAAAGT